MTIYISPIVEGETEDKCLEPLLQRIWNEEIQSSMRLQVFSAIVSKRDQLLSDKHSQLLESVERAAIRLKSKLQRDVGSSGIVLLLLDAETDCPIQLANKLLSRCKRDDIQLACVLAMKMFENWIVAGASTLAGFNNLPDTLPACVNPEEVHGSVWLDKQMRLKDATRKYRKTDDAREFVRRMNLVDAHNNSRSFRKLCKELRSLLPPPIELTPETPT